MPGGFGENYRRQKPRPPISAGIINQGLPVLEGLSRLGVGAGLSMQSMSGLIPLLRLVGVHLAYAQAGAADIPARTINGDGLIVPGVGECLILVRTAGGILRPRAKPEPCENVFSMAVPAGWQPIIVVKIDGVWSIAQPDCVPVA